MVKIAFVRGGFDKNAKQEVPGVYTESELANKIHEFSQLHNIVDVQPFGSHMVMVKYE